MCEGQVRKERAERTGGGRQGGYEKGGEGGYEEDQCV
jgi:hypothetical protein